MRLTRIARRVDRWLREETRGARSNLSEDNSRGVRRLHTYMQSADGCSGSRIRSASAECRRPRFGGAGVVWRALQFLVKVPIQTGPVCTNPDKKSAALVHYQIEAIHPFLDGNGAIGRLLTTLLLCARDLLPDALLYLSAYFEAHRHDYYGALLVVSQRGVWNEWLVSFLRGEASLVTAWYHAPPLPTEVCCHYPATWV